MLHTTTFTPTTPGGQPAPTGDLTLVASDRGLRAVLWPDDEGRVPASDEPVVVDPDHPVLRRAVQELTEYFAGTRSTFDVPLDPVGTPFQLQVWRVLRGIPFGETISYGEQAARLGDPRKARAVGAANGKNPLSIIVPCHRVIGSTGKLTGFAAGLDVKAWLLQHEHRNERLPLDA